MFKKLLSILLAFAICISGVALYYKLSPRMQEQKMFDLFKQGQYASVETKINCTRLPHSPSFYKGYIAQIERRFDDADRYFQTALLYSKNEEKKFFSDLYLALGSNAYFEGKNDIFFSKIEKAQGNSPLHYALPFFEGLQAYLLGDFTLASSRWEAFSPPEELKQQSWFLFTLDALFSPAWKDLHLAHALIESGEIIKGRSLIETETTRLDENECDLQQFAHHLLGLTYLLEAKQLPLKDRESHYKIAQYYFEATPLTTDWLTHHVLETTERLLLVESEDQCKVWALPFIHLLQTWHADAVLDNLAHRTALKILNENDLFLCQSIRTEFSDTRFHLLVTQKILDAFGQRAREGWGDPFESWSLIHALTPFTEESGKELASYTLREVFRTIQKNDASFKHLNQYIAFWEQFGPKKEEKEEVAQELLFLSKQFWFREGEEKKGEYLMTLALKLSSNTMEEIENFLVDLYHQAENSNLINRLAMVYDSLDHFHIHRQELISKGLFANHLADAQYLYEARHYNSAKAISCWLLKIEPFNYEALRIAGLSYFHLGDYNSAFALLQELPNPDPVTYKALLLSQVLVSQGQETHLAQIGHTD